MLDCLTAVERQRDLPKRGVRSIANCLLDSCVRKCPDEHKKYISFKPSEKNIKAAIFLNHCDGCGAQSNDVCKMSHDRCPQ